MLLGDAGVLHVASVKMMRLYLLWSVVRWGVVPCRGLGLWRRSVVSCCIGVVQSGLLLWWTVRPSCVESGKRAGGRGCEGDLRLCLRVVVGES